MYGTRSFPNSLFPEGKFLRDSLARALSLWEESSLQFLEAKGFWRRVSSRLGFHKVESFGDSRLETLGKTVREAVAGVMVWPKKFSLPLDEWFGHEHDAAILPTSL